MPLRTGEMLRLEARLNRPAYVYLLWVDGRGEVAALYPWDRDRDQTVNDPPPRAAPVAEVECPPAKDRGWPLEGDGGLETILLLARPEPLPADVRLAEVLAGLPPTPLRDLREVVVRGLERGRPLPPRDWYRKPGKRTKELDDDLQRLQERLRPHFEVIRLLQFAHKGKG
jgi:hypothetical protein